MADIGEDRNFPSNFDMPRPYSPPQNRVTTQNGVTANQVAERPRKSQSRGRATNSLWGRDCMECIKVCSALPEIEVLRFDSPRWQGSSQHFAAYKREMVSQDPKCLQL